MIPVEVFYIPAFGDDNQQLGGVPTRVSIQCATCKNWLNGLTCRAFSEGIPMSILTGKFDHRRSFEGDNEILYEPIHQKALDELNNSLEV